MSNRLTMGIMSALFAALTSALSLIVVPLPLSPVPVTGQTLGVMLSGAVLEPMWAASSVLIYIALGCLGFPVFAGGQSGPGTLAGPTAGYLAGFVIGAIVTGLLVETFERLRARRGMSFATYLASTIIGGVLVVHACGIVWLAHAAQVSLGKAFIMGSAPFLPGDALKAVVASLIAGRLRRNLTALRSNRWR